MGIWDHEERRQRYELVRLENEQVRQQKRGVEVLKRVARERDMSGQNFHPGPDEVTIDFAPIVQAQQEVASSIYAVAQAESANGVILTRIEDGIDEGLVIQQGMLDELLVIEDVMRDGFTYLGVRLSRIDSRLSDIAGELREANELHQAHLDETRLQGELGRAQMAQLHQAHLDEMRTQGELGRVQMARLISTQIQENWKRTQFQEEGAERRHQEKMGALQSIDGRLITPAAISANEKFTHAMTQYDTGNVEACLVDLEDVFTQQSTHVPGHILFGVCAFKLGQSDVAKDAFRHAANYALHDKLIELYVDAMLRLARLERLVGNHDQGLAVIREALEAVGVNEDPDDSTIDLHNQLAYEEVLARFVHPDRTESPEEIVRDLRGVLCQRPELRDEVAGSPLWKEVVDADPYLRYGNAPFIILAEAWMDLNASEKPCADPDLYDIALHLCEVGKRQFPTAVRDHLSSVQERPVWSMGILDHSGYEQMQIWLYQTLAFKGQDQEARRVLYADLNPRVDVWLPEVAFERFKFELKGRPVDEEMIRRIKTNLRRILCARPHLRDRVAHDSLFEECRERCSWLSSGNSPYAQLGEVVGILPLVEALDVSQDVKDDLGSLVRDICRIINETNWGRGTIGRNDRLFIQQVEPFFLRLAGQESAPPTLEAVSTLVRDQAVEIRFYALMIQPCTDASQLPAFEECFQQMYAVSESARQTVATSPLFEGYRHERAMEDQRLRHEEEEEQRLLREAQEAQRREAQKEAQRLRREEEEAQRLHRQQVKERADKALKAWVRRLDQLRRERERISRDGARRGTWMSGSILACLWEKFQKRFYDLQRVPDPNLTGENLSSWYEHRTCEIERLLQEVATEEKRMHAQQRAQREWNSQQERQKKEQRTLFRQALLRLSGAILCSCFVAIFVGLRMTGELSIPDMSGALPIIVVVVILLKGFYNKISEWWFATHRANRRTPIKED